jgi:hypothetical protein
MPTSHRAPLFSEPLPLSVSLSNTAALAATPAADLAGRTITELELLEPTIQEEATSGALAAKLGDAEAREVIAEAVSLEREADALEVKMDATVGADTGALDAAAVPLKARVDQLARLVALVGNK